jgi:hypothetical protein
MTADLRPIVLWAVPRSVSTAFERSFQQHPAVEVVHEPFTDCYYFGPQRRSARYGELPAGSTAARQPDQIMSVLLAVRPKTVFVKELAFQGEPFASDDFLGRVRNAIILRSPERVLRSLQPLKPDHTAEEFGFDALWRLWLRMTKLGLELPPVVDGDTFRVAPEAVLRGFCRRIGEPFTDAMLRWPLGSIRIWRSHEAESQARWHHTLEASTGVLPPDVAGGPCARLAVGLPDYLRRAWSVYDELTASPGT